MVRDRLATHIPALDSPSSRLYTFAPLLVYPIIHTAFSAAVFMAALAPCDVPNAGAPMQLGVAGFTLLLLIAGFARFGGALLGYIFNNGGKVVAGLALFMVALWVIGGIDSLIPFFYSQVSGEPWGQSGLQCAVPGSNNSSA